MTANPAIVLIGFMGAGKSTAAEMVATKTGVEAVDSDALFERRFGMTIDEFFAAHGEEEFRRHEEALATELLADADGGAIALGGGSILSSKVREALGGHLVVWLKVGPAEAWRRVGETDRPLARRQEDFYALLAERTPLYESVADAVVPVGEETLSPDGQSHSLERALPWIRWLAQLPVETRMLWAHSAGGSYPVFVGRGLLEAEWWPLGGRRFCISDSTVGDLYAELLAPLAGRVKVEPGETAKTMAGAERALRELARAGMTREDHVVALGGGVVGDLAGFCAHTYQRGVPVVQVPTTLVAQVDSAYGGKTGVDLPEGKNYVGAYHLPAAVVADTSTLASLPAGDLAAGFVEALKTGLLAGGALWERVRSIEALDSAELDDVVLACASHKCDVVAIDERDSGWRATLNLGHTVGHAIETASGYSRYRHGEAIGLGLLAALRLSEAPELRREVAEILARHDLPVEIDPAIDPEQILDALQRDKKRTAAGVGFVLLAQPGSPRVGQLVEPAKVEAAVKELYRP